MKRARTRRRSLRAASRPSFAASAAIGRRSTATGARAPIRALTDYYRNTKQNIASTEPTVGLLGDLFLRSGRICKQPVIVKKAVKSSAKVASDDELAARKGRRRQEGRQAGRRKQTRSPAA